MADTITPGELAAALASACQEYTEDVREKVEAGVEKIGKEAAQEVRQLAPVYSGNNKYEGWKAKYGPGSYKRGWKYSVERKRGTVKITVHNTKHYQRTHLLENGHLNRDGTTRSKAIPHISTANADAEKKVDKLLEDL
jgi:hypothetical protein